MVQMGKKFCKMFYFPLRTSIILRDGKSLGSYLRRRFSRIGIVLCFLLFHSNVSVNAADVYQVDTSHSSVEFAVKHLTVSTVKGAFTDFEGSIQLDKADIQFFTAELTIKTASVDTHHAKRDEHLKGGDFFDVEKYPVINFKSKSLTEQSAGQYLLTGDLTMHGVTKEIAMPVTIEGPVPSPFGGEVIGLSGKVTINRQDYGISWNKSLDAGGYVVGDEVQVLVNIEAGKK